MYSLPTSWDLKPGKRCEDVLLDSPGNFYEAVAREVTVKYSSIQRVTYIIVAEGGCPAT